MVSIVSISEAQPYSNFACSCIVFFLLEKFAGRSVIRTCCNMGDNRALKKMLEEEVKKRRRLEDKVKMLVVAAPEQREMQEDLIMHEMREIRLEEQKELNHVVVPLDLILFCCVRLEQARLIELKQLRDEAVQRKDYTRAAEIQTEVLLIPEKTVTWGMFKADVTKQARLIDLGQLQEEAVQR